MGITFRNNGQGGRIRFRSLGLGGRFASSFVAPAVPFVGLLDTYPNAAAAYSLRKLRTAYSGAAIRVRRSNDNAEQDIGFDGSGNLNEAALTSFVGANNGFVTTWYDQSGNARNATQVTGTRQPIIVSSGVIVRNPVNNRIVAQFNYSVDQFLITSNQTFAGDATMFGIYNINQLPNLTTEFSYGVFSYGEESNARRRSILIWNGGSGNTWYHYASAFAQNVQIAQVTVPINSLVYSLFNHTSQQISGGYNGNTAVAASRTLTNPSASPIYIGTTGTGERLNGNIFELIMYNFNQSSNRTGIENNINDYYNIYWNGDFTGLLDTYPSSAAAYSLRNLSSTYTGPLIRVRRSSDNTEMDIYGTYYGNLDEAALTAFVGVNSAFVTTWYDQSGNNQNATQTTQASQPRIVNAGTIDRQNGKPAIFYDGTNDRFETAIETMDLNSGDNVSGFTVIMPNNITSFRSIITKFDAPTSSASVEDGWGFRITSASKLNIFFGQNTLYSNTTSGPGNETNNIQRLASFFANGGSLTTNPNIFRNGADITDTRTGVVTSLDNTTYVVRIGALKYINVFYDHWSGTMQEIILYNADKRTDRTGIESNINTHYGIY